MKHILSIDFDIPGFNSNKKFSSKASLNDCDIVLFAPFTYYSGNESKYQGLDSFNDVSSTQIRDCSNYWKQEIASYLESGRNIFITLKSFYTFFVKTGQHTYSGTGKNARKTNFVEEFNNYKFLDIKNLELIATHGERMKVVNKFFSEFVELFNPYISYKNYIKHPELNPTLKLRMKRK